MNLLWNVLESHNKIGESASEVHNIKNLCVMEPVMECVGKLQQNGEKCVGKL